MLVQGSNSHFGHYTMDESEHTITFVVDNAFYPNWEGTVQKRSYTCSGDTLSYVVTHTTQGGGAVVAEVTWRRW